ncbi:MAG TPA: valine--pyruvate transaminase [Vicinamibacteria bacterium]|nr:valine--pyruvate transaminase [Vicinamibacteria bacterium]
MKRSRFGAKFTRESGILRLMNDLGEAASADSPVLALGGGNPARIPEVESLFRKRVRNALDSGDELERLIGSYDSPRGNREFIEALARLLKNQFAWKLADSNIALTSGSQTSFFFLFNLLAGQSEDGCRRRIFFPLAPEYIGYGDVGIEPDMFVSRRPEIELIPPDLFKYHIDFEALSLGDDVAAICVSRPTNPTANVLTGGELARLSELARGRAIPLIVDNAYGTPFPDIVFNDAEPVWDENVILTMSLSKLGLPGARTGIVIADEETIRAISTLNAIVSLAPGSFGAFLALELVKSGEILDVARRVVRPFYERKSRQALEWVRESFRGLPYRVHVPEGTFFLWLWFEGMPISSQDLYERLKARNVLVVPGHHFFPGLEEDWRHRNECIRINYAGSDPVVRRGLGLVAEEIRAAFR